MVKDRLKNWVAKGVAFDVNDSTVRILQILLSATLMEVIVVDLVSTENNVRNALVLMQKKSMEFLMLLWGMEFVMMKQTMPNACMMILTAVGITTMLNHSG